MSAFRYGQAETARHRTRAEKARAESGPPPLHSLTFPDFCRLLSIRTKEGTLVSFAPENWYDEQRSFVGARTYRNVTLKDRQIGFTTLLLAWDLYYCVKHGCLVNVLIIVHTGDIADQLFIALRLFEGQLKHRGQLPPTLYSNKREVVFRAGGAVRIVEAGNTEEVADARGRSGTIHRLHLTELAFYRADEATLAAVMSCVPADGEVDIESTPNGPSGKFYEHVQAARAGSSGYAFFFFGWLDHGEYRASVPPDFDPAPRDEHEQRFRSFGADDAQIQWWRAKVADPSIGLKKALREFPSDPDSCFEHHDFETVLVPEFSAATHVVRNAVPPHAHCYASMDPGMRDKLGIVWGYWDFERQKLVIQRSYAERNVTTTPAADLMKLAERDLWLGAQPGTEPLRYWDGRQLCPNPYMRYSDVDARFVTDLSNEHGIRFATTAKDDPDAQLVAVRNAFLANKIEIWPESGPLQEQLAGGRWNAKRTDWERSDRLGHLDCVAALIYLWRNVQRTLNPNPPVQHDPDTTFVHPSLKQQQGVSNAVRAINEVTGPVRKWGRR